MAQWLTKQAEKVIETLGQGTLHVCSVGCGDGKLDKEILASLSAAHPALTIEYVGVGLCEQVCEEVAREMEGVGDNVVVQVIARDYSELSKEEVGMFNCVLMVNCLCYSSAPDVTLEAVLQLLEPAGELIIVSSSRHSVDELIGRFWKHQRHYDLCTTEDVVDMLQKSGRKHSISQLPVTFDLSSCIKDGFECKESKLVLDHMMQVNMEEYSPAIRELVVKYLVNISAEGSVKTMSDVIAIQ